VHYVSQEVKLTAAARSQTPGDFVVAADVERRELLAEAAWLDAKALGALPATATFGGGGGGRAAGGLSGGGGGGLGGGSGGTGGGVKASDASGGGWSDQEQRRYAEVTEQLELISADSAERRAAELLKALGFTDELRARPLKELSGGWRVRTALAAAIFAKPDLLLLDEPTNHLSIAAVLWLARELSQGDAWKDRTIVIVSHDRFFVDEATQTRGFFQYTYSSTTTSFASPFPFCFILIGLLLLLLLRLLYHLHFFGSLPCFIISGLRRRASHQRRRTPADPDARQLLGVGREAPRAASGVRQSLRGQGRRSRQAANLRRPRLQGGVGGWEGGLRGGWVARTPRALGVRAFEGLVQLSH
jgi:hypothetical protein